jgi:hypothetical protein
MIGSLGIGISFHDPKPAYTGRARGTCGSVFHPTWTILFVSVSYQPCLRVMPRDPRHSRS